MHIVELQRKLQEARNDEEMFVVIRRVGQTTEDSSRGIILKRGKVMNI